jgi:hypothetical protein
MIFDQQDSHKRFAVVKVECWFFQEFAVILVTNKLRGLSLVEDNKALVFEHSHHRIVYFRSEKLIGSYLCCQSRI